MTVKSLLKALDYGKSNVNQVELYENGELKDVLMRAHAENDKYVFTTRKVKTFLFEENLSGYTLIVNMAKS